MSGPPPLPGRRSTGSRSPGVMFANLAGDRLRTVPIDAIVPNPDQPRKRFDEEALALLAESIAARGVLQPPTVVETVQNRYQIVAGERRWRAARIAGLREIDVLLREASDRSTELEDALLENTARQDLTPVEEARAYQLLIDDLGISVAELGRRTARSRASVSNHLRLLQLPVPVLDLVEDGKLGFAHARALLAIGEPAATCRLATAAVEEGWTARETERVVRDRTAAASPAASGAKERAEQQSDPRGPLVTRAISERLGEDVKATITGTALTISARSPQGARAVLAALGVDPALLD